MTDDTVTAGFKKTQTNQSGIDHPNANHPRDIDFTSVPDPVPNPLPGDTSAPKTDKHGDTVKA